LNGKKINYHQQKITGLISSGTKVHGKTVGQLRVPLATLQHFQFADASKTVV
jgi:hypothetical protein